MVFFKVKTQKSLTPNKKKYVKSKSEYPIQNTTSYKLIYTFLRTRSEFPNFDSQTPCNIL